jgi:flavin-dependent dehydrogenase
MRHPCDVPSATPSGGLPWETVVVGAGPAGAATALRLARGGQRVLLVDRSAMPRGKVCGCCLSPVALRELSDLAAGESLLDRLAPVPLASMTLVQGARSARFAFRGGAVVSRERLDTAIVETGRAAGVAWRSGVEVVSVTADDGDGAVSLALRSVDDGHLATIRAERCVLATGLVERVGGDAKDTGDRAGRLRNGQGGRCVIGVGTTLPAGVIDLPAGELCMVVGRRGYCGLVRLEDGRIDVAAAIDREAVRDEGGPADAVRGVIRGARGIDAVGLAEALAGARLAATPPLTRRSTLASADGRILRVGDAAAYVEPFTGEGIGWALVASRLAADAILGGERGTAIGARYTALHDAHLRASLSRCRRVAAWIGSPRLVTAAVVGARCVPRVAARIAPLVIGAGAREWIR